MKHEIEMPLNCKLLHVCLAVGVIFVILEPLSDFTATLKVHADLRIHVKVMYRHVKIHLTMHIF